MAQFTSEITSAQVTVPNGDLMIDAYLARPKSSHSCPAVIVLQEIFGVTEYIREVTQQLAHEGYVAIAPSLYQRIAPGLELSYSQEDVLKGRNYRDQTKTDELLSDTKATVAYLRSLSYVQPDAIGCVGFCFGGHVAYLAACETDIRSVACFYPVGIATSNETGISTLSRTQNISGRIELFLGIHDTVTTEDEVGTIEAELEAHQIPYQIHRYDADHGFHSKRRTRNYNALAAEAAWEQTKRLFASTLLSS
jgi:carboxymethylenebutenolidase